MKSLVFAMSLLASGSAFAVSAAPLPKACQELGWKVVGAQTDIEDYASLNIVKPLVATFQPNETSIFEISFIYERASGVCLIKSLQADYR